MRAENSLWLIDKVLIFIKILISIPIQRLKKKTQQQTFVKRKAFPKAVRRISENCFRLSLTGKLRELWSFVFFFCKAAKLI